MRALRPRFARFIVGGAANTAATHGLFVVLSWSIPPSLAYSIAYLSGIVLAYVINTTFVFRTRASIRTAARFPAVYVVSYLVGLSLIVLLTEAGMTPWLAMLGVIAVNVPLTFVMVRYVLKGPNSLALATCRKPFSKG
ncbi:GtrA family protein [Nonomuraea sp. NPDC049141]|uniref:GtrA family protein n=1 Tax=Nonomuraea sp. NPDC049141 TaxID=3155500 RepID=UPI00340EF7E7